MLSQKRIKREFLVMNKDAYINPAAWPLESLWPIQGGLRRCYGPTPDAAPPDFLGPGAPWPTPRNPFCTLIAQTSRGCSVCLETEQRAVDAAQDRPATVRC